MLNTIRNSIKSDTHFECFSHIQKDGTGAVLAVNPWVVYGFFVGNYFGQRQLSVSTITRLQRDSLNAVRKCCTLRCADIGISIKGTKIVEGMDRAVAMFSDPIQNIDKFDMHSTIAIEEALQEISVKHFSLPSVNGSSVDNCYLIEGLESMISITYKRSHLPILYTHVPDYKAILRQNVWSRVIDALGMRFYGFHEHDSYLNAISILEDSWLEKQKLFCEISGCEPEGAYRRQIQGIPLNNAFVRNPSHRPINANDDGGILDPRPMESLDL